MSTTKADVKVSVTSLTVFSVLSPSSLQKQVLSTEVSQGLMFLA